VPTPLKAGEVLRGRYQISRIIGQGGMGSIYLADDLRLEGRQCALKEVEHDRSLSDELLKQAREQFFREATVLARLDHPNLPKVSDFFSSGGRDYLVMDYIPGKDLRAMMNEARQKDKFLPENSVLGWANQLADALTYMHSQQPPIVHRDIKPSNLKVTPSGLLKLVDFGLVKILAAGDVTVTVLQGRGTALYTPLEQYGGDAGHTDIRSDVYSFGATFYHLLTNHPPPEARELFLNPDKLIPPRQLNPEINPRTEQAILWSLSLHPDERPQDVETFRAALVGEQPINRKAYVRLPEQSVEDAVSSPAERVLLFLSVGIVILSLLVTIFR
jgi:eukaryotic-like serine/threonine-protein kinase